MVALQELAIVAQVGLEAAPVVVPKIVYFHFSAATVETTVVVVVADSEQAARFACYVRSYFAGFGRNPYPSHCILLMSGLVVGN